MSGDTPPGSAELVIIGGGLAGVGTAYYAAKRGVAAIVLEKGEVGCEQSSRAWGYVRQQERDPLELAMMMASNALWRNLEFVAYGACFFNQVWSYGQSCR